jgi:hypothetical protein
LVGIQSLWQFGAGYVSDSPEKFTRHSIFPVKLNLKSILGENTKLKKVIPGNDFCFLIDGMLILMVYTNIDY